MYLRFAPFMRNQLPHTDGIHTIGFLTNDSYNAALYTVLLCAVDGEILLLPVLVHHYITLHYIKFKEKNAIALQDTLQSLSQFRNYGNDAKNK